MNEKAACAADIEFMTLAVAEAGKAASAGDIPVGCVVVFRGRVIASAHNAREAERNALRHAELTAIDAACRALNGWRLHGCTLYVTLEPCAMCAGAIVNARLDRVVFGAYDAKAGAFGSVINLNSYPLNHKPELTGGVMQRECGMLLSDFFGRLRNKQGSGQGK